MVSQMTPVYVIVQEEKFRINQMLLYFSKSKQLVSVSLDCLKYVSCFIDQNFF